MEVAAILFLFVVCAAVAQSSSAGQGGPGGQSVLTSRDSSQWVGYLGGTQLTTGRDAVTTVENQIAAWLRAKTARSAAVQDIYIEARRESWSAPEYKDRLEAAAAAEAQPLAAIREALQVLGDLMRESPPAAGSAASRDAEAWLTRVADTLGVTTNGVAELLEEVQSQGQNGSESAASDFVAALDLPLPPGFGAASTQDQLTEVVGQWWLFFLCAPDGSHRSQRLTDLSRAARLLSPDLASAASLLAGNYRSAERQVRRIHDAASDALPWVTAETVAAFGATDSQEPAAGSIAPLFLALQTAGRDNLVAAAITDSTTAFAITSAERLLADLSDRQAAEIGRATGLGLAQIRSLAWTLYRVRLDLAEAAIFAALADAQTAAEAYRQSGDYRDQVDLLRGYKAEGENHLRGLDPWVSGTRARSGDSFRWEMLSVLSNRYSQYLLLGASVSGESESGAQRVAETQRMVGAFVSDLYAGMVRRLPDTTALRLLRETAGDVALSYDRTYSLNPGNEASDSDQELDMVYDAFVSEAQGVDELRSGLSASSGLEAGMNVDWSHAHGLSIVVAGIQTSRMNAALAWFTLANLAQVEMQGFSHAVRGVFALRTAIHVELEPALRAAGYPEVALYDARLAIAMKELSNAEGFETSPGEILAVLHGLYPEAYDIAALIETLETSVRTISNRLADVEAADRRIIQRAAGVLQ